MINQTVNSPLSRLRERWSDPLLTTLTVLMILMLFVFAPLQAVGVRMFQMLEFASALGLIGGVFFMSGSPMVLVALLAAFIMASTAAISRLRSPSVLDIYVFASALLLMGGALATVVGGPAFPSGRLTHRRVICAILG